MKRICPCNFLLGLVLGSQGPGVAESQKGLGVHMPQGQPLAGV